MSGFKLFTFVQMACIIIMCVFFCNADSPNPQQEAVPNFGPKADICLFASLQYGTDGFVSTDVLKLYCKANCRNLAFIDCKTVAAYDDGSSWTKKVGIFKWYDPTNDFNNPSTYSPKSIYNISDTVEKNWWKIIYHIMPVMIAYFCAFLVRLSGNDSGVYVVASISALVTAGIGSNYVYVLHNFVVVVTFGFGGKSVIGASDAIACCICFLLVISFMVISTTLLFQAVVILVAIICYFGMLKNFFDKKTNVSVTLSIVTVQIFVLGDIMRYIVTNLAFNSPGLNFLFVFTDSFVPYGPSSFWYQNAIYRGLLFVRSLDYGCSEDKEDDCLTESKKLHIFWMFVIGQGLLFVLLRAIIGGAILRSMRYRYDLGILMDGLHVYCCAMFLPVTMLRNLLCGIGRHDGMTYTFIFVGTVLNYYEARYAVESFAIKTAWFAFNRLLGEWDNSDIIAHLQLGMTFDYCSFPKLKSNAWIDVAQIDRIVKACQLPLFVYSDGTEKPVSGCFRKFSGKSRFVTIEHCAKGVKQMKLGGNIYPVESVDFLGASHDRVAEVNFSGIVEEFCELEHISEESIPDVQAITCVRCDKTGARFSNTTDKFKVDMENGQILVHTDFTFGDSGTQAFAGDRNGNLFAIGNVSAGIDDKRQPNILALATASTVSNAEKFNRDRGRLIKKGKLNSEVLEEILRSYSAAYDEMKHGDAPTQDEGDNENENYEYDKFEDYDKGDPYDYRGGRSKKDAKARNKDRATRKRNPFGYHTDALKDLANRVDDDSEIERIIKAIEDGREVIFDGKGGFRFGDEVLNTVFKARGKE